MPKTEGVQADVNASSNALDSSFFTAGVRPDSKRNVT